MQAAIAEAWQEAKGRYSQRATPWPATYINHETGRAYEPHSEEEARFVFTDRPPFPIVTGGEGSGKTAAGSIKALERIRRGMSGIIVSPTLPHFANSTWAEFKRWIPWQHVMPEDRYMERATWTPSQQ